MNAEKTLRWKQIFRDDGNMVIVAKDHSLWNTVSGLDNHLTMVKKIAGGGADAICQIVHDGTRSRKPYSISRS